MILNLYFNMETNKNILKVIIAGGRDFNNYELLKTKVDKILSNKKRHIKFTFYLARHEGQIH